MCLSEDLRTVGDLRWCPRVAWAVPLVGEGSVRRRSSYASTPCPIASRVDVTSRLSARQRLQRRLAVQGHVTGQLVLAPVLRGNPARQFGAIGGAMKREPSAMKRSRAR